MIAICRFCRRAIRVRRVTQRSQMEAHCRTAKCRLDTLVKNYRYEGWYVLKSDSATCIRKAGFEVVRPTADALEGPYMARREVVERFRQVRRLIDLGRWNITGKRRRALLLRVHSDPALLPMIETVARLGGAPLTAWLK